VLCAVALGCSSNGFEIADSPDGAITDSNVVANDSSTPPKDSEAPDTQIARDSGPTAMDAGPVDVGVACARTGDCPPNHYCKYPGCGVSIGTCAALSPLPGPYYNPVCGCDGTTFWNKEFAYVNSVAIKHDDPCTPTERKLCTTAGSACDTPDSLCVVQLPSATTCSVTPQQGGCWRMPTGIVCGTDAGPPMLTCSAVCMSQCNAVKSKTAFYPASCTPG